MCEGVNAGGCASVCVCVTEGVYKGVSAGVGVNVRVRPTVRENNTSTGNIRKFKDKEIDVANKI